MNRRYTPPTDDDSNKTVKRYEDFLSGKSPAGYFDVEEIEIIVEYYLRKGRTADSTEALNLGLKMHPNNGSLSVKRAKIYLAMGDALKAYRLLEGLAEKNDYEVVLLKIESLVKLDRDNEAAELCRTLLSTGESSNADYIYLDIAFVYMNKQNFETAIQYLEQGYLHNPKNIDVLFELAYCYEQMDDYENAILIQNRIIDADPYTTEAWFNLGQIHFSRQNYNKAIEAYDYVLAIDPNDSFVYLQKGHVMAQLDRFQEAIDNYKEFINLTVDSWQVYIYVAECYEKLDKYEEAISYYSQVLDLMPENLDALTGIAVCLLELERYQESLTYLRTALENKIDSAEVWIYTAEAYIGLDQSDCALIAYLRALDYEPHQAETLLTVGNLYLEKSDFVSALQYYESAFKENRTLEHINLFLSVVHFKLGNVELSLHFLQEAIDNDENAVSLFLELCPEANNLANKGEKLQ